MIWIFNMERASAGVCDNYHDAFQYLAELEGLKRYQCEKPLSDLFDLITDESLLVKKNWCVDYCKSHHFTIIETPQIIDSTLPQWTPKSQDPTREKILDIAS